MNQAENQNRPLSPRKSPPTQRKKATFDMVLVQAQQRPSGFDYLRNMLSLAVIAWHAVCLSYGIQFALQLPVYQLIPVRSILICFFVLSGFLVAGSLSRNKTLFTFLGLRVLRIVPALSVEVLLSALVLGPLVTTWAWSNYFADGAFAAYFLNILGFIHYTLPGVFEKNPFPNTVNGQLWTVPYELYCYAALAALAVTGFVWRRRWLLFLVLVAQAALALYGWQIKPSWIDFVPGMSLLLAFVAGVLFYEYRKVIRFSAAYALVSAAMAGLLLAHPKGGYFAVFPLAYLTLYVGLLNPTRLKFMQKGDYSYGLYLYGFPFQQLIASWGGGFLNGYVNFALAALMALVVAVMSWHWVERPALQWRSNLIRWESHLLGRGTWARFMGPLSQRSRDNS